MFSGQCRQRRRRHWPVVEYLVRDAKADIHHQDHDRWTVLHNACSSGHGPMVEFLVEQGADVNMPNRMGHTPLINAASRGHVSIVEYLLEKAKANPLWVNLSGETAYDAAATARHFYLCEILEQNEKAWWTGSRGSTADFDVRQWHRLVPVILYENQRAQASLMGLGKPVFSVTALHRLDKCGPWSVPGGGPQSPGQVEVPTGWRWAMSEWEIDHSKPRMDKEGWEYARTFGASDWSAQEPSSGTHWVRRRRWARMMNRLDMDRQDSESEECPQSVSNPLRWQKDDEVLECCCCERVFGFFLRKHHCRQCGMIVCDKCSGQRWPLSSPVQVPYTTTVNKTQQGGLQRVCDRCALKRQSVLVDCPVCENSLYGLGKEERERHLEECLSTAQRPKPGEHVVYTLEGGPLVGEECVICLEEFAVGDTVARLSCLCSYHRHCIHDWFAITLACPVHA
ncbi:hypothetical protein J3Q64DRAFT_1396210 [Phycomyces blakesleeanus]|uniref:Uncharacterized protein n=1 Tax=Phycomyces blakesleeanus TaxID=4837 RepID=A0ABR3B539_PHYBL